MRPLSIIPFFFQFFLIQLLFTSLRTAEILFANEFDNAVAVGGVKQMKCNNNFWLDFQNKFIVGQYSSSFNGSPLIRTYTSLPAHWSIAISFDLILFRIDEWYSTDKLQILVDGAVKDTYFTENISPSKSFCTSYYYDTLKLYHLNLTHSTSFVELQLKSSFTSTYASYGIRNIILQIETCHFSCLTCNGPTSSNCLSCPINSFLSGSQCKCNNGLFAYMNGCIGSCPAGFYQNTLTNQCEDDKCDTLKCLTCSTPPNRSCQACKPGYYLHIDLCVSSCPSYAPLTLGVCKDPMSTFNNGKYALKGLFGSTFGESEITGMNLQFSSFYGNGLENSSHSRQIFTICGGVYLFGGHNLAASSSKFKWQSSTLDPHYKLTISFTIYLIDSWDTEKLQIQVDGTTIKTYTEDFNTFPNTNLCGLVEYNDKIEKFSQTISHTSSSIDFQILTTLNEKPYNEAIGIRDVYILLEACTDNCASCNSTGCLSCKSGYGLYNYFCFNPCPNGYWNNSGICSSCDLSCQKCNGSGPNSCTACPSGKFLYNNKCVPICPLIQYYPDSVNNICQLCDPSCYKCQSPGDNQSCTECQSSYLLNGQCLPHCPAYYYESGKLCIPCESTCLTCSGSSANQCLTCLLPRKLQTKDNTCSLTCPDFDQYENSNQCINCDSSCASCSTAGPNACTKCNSPKFLDGTQCVLSCLSNQYGDTVDRTCHLCNSNCLTCQNSSIECTSCTAPLKLQLKTNQCVNSCDSDQYYDSGNNSCKLCDASCKKCTSTSTQCTECNSPLFLKGTQCVPNCGSSYYGDTVDLKCKLCDSTCQTCNGPNNNQCITCVSPLVYYSLEKECKPNCRSDQYYDNGSNTCFPCHTDCLTCSGPANTQCLSCSPNLLEDNKCVTICKATNYPDISTHECKNCDLNCNTCSGHSNNECLSCITPKKLQGTKCQLNCDSGYYFSSTDQKCMSCNPNCLTCSNSPTECVTCPSGFVLDSVTKTCSNSCTSSQYLDIPSNSCKPCSLGCKTCSGSTNTDCLSCNSPNVLQGTQCQSSCDYGYYFSSIDQKCMICNSNCQTCQNTSIECVTCPPSKILDFTTKTCVSSCASNQYLDSPINSCKPCNSTCKTCSGSLSTDCLSCNSPKQQQIFAKVYNFKNVSFCQNYRVLQGSKCQLGCDNGFYYNSVDQMCKYCNSNCLTCQNTSIECVTCPSGMILDSVTKKCVNFCASNQYQDSGNNSCQQCNSNCQTCSGQLATNCLSCKTPNVLQGTQCQSSCDNGYYYSSIDQKCQECNSNCQKCQNTSTECIACQSGQVLDSSAKVCKGNCATNQYLENVTNSCKLCDINCKTCSGPSSFNCLSCNSPNILQGTQCQSSCNTGYYYSITDQKCMICNINCLSCQNTSTECATCPIGQFLDSQAKSCVSSCSINQYLENSNNLCKQCQSSCKTCSGPSMSDCLSCNTPLYLENNQCVSNCAHGSYQDSNQTCKQCNQNCATCTTSSITCESCQLPLILQTMTSSCVNTCNSDQYKDITANKCIQCSKICQTCSGPSAYECLTCAYGKHLSNGSCIEKCLQGQYSDNYVCKQCDKSCFQCQGGNKNQCTKCSNSLFLYNGICILQCPADDFFTDKINFECKKCHENCKNKGCYGIGADQCNNSVIEPQNSLIVMIVAIKTIFWIISSIFGYFIDKKEYRQNKEKIAKIMNQASQPQLCVKDIQVEELVEKQVHIPQAMTGIRRKRTKFFNKNINIMTNNNIGSQQTLGSALQINSNFSNSPTKSTFKKDTFASISNFQLDNSIQDQGTQVAYDNSPSDLDSPIKTARNKYILRQQTKNDILPTFSGNDPETHLSSQKSIEEYQKSPRKYSYSEKFKYTMIGNELVSLFVLYDPDMSRVFRSTLIYIKYLAFLLATEFIYYNGAKLLLIPAIFFGIIVKGLLYKIFISINVCLRYGALLATVILIGTSVTDIVLWFVPIVKTLYWNKDLHWSIFYLVVFGCDLILIQQIISLIKYISSVRSLNIKDGFLQRLLNQGFTSKSLLLKIIKS